MINTMCKDCLFAQTVDKTPCEYNIPDIVENDKEIDSENYYVIKNYICKYGYSKKIYYENIDKFHDINIKDYIRTKNVLHYSMVLFLDKDLSDVQPVIDNLNKLSIKPQHLSVVSFNSTDHLRNKLTDEYNFNRWKIHHFLEDTTPQQAMHILYETNKQKLGDLIWILTNQSLQKCVDNDSIQNLNYSIYVMQKPCHYFKHKNIDSNFDGIFIDSTNYSIFSATDSRGIETTDENLIISYYD